MDSPTNLNAYLQVYLADGKLTGEEAAKLVRHHNDLQRFSRTQLASLLSQYGHAPRDYGLDVDAPIVDGGVSIRKLPNAQITIPKRPEPNVSNMFDSSGKKGFSLSGRPLSFTKRRNITWLSIVGPSAIVSLIGVLGII